MHQAYSSRLSIAMAVEIAKPRTIVRGFRTYSSEPAIAECASRPIAGRLAVADQASAGHPVAVGRPGRASVGHPVAVGHLAAGQVSGSDSDSWFFLSNVASPLRSLVFHGRSQSAADAFVPEFALKQLCPELVPRMSSSLCNTENRR